jgi:hypothetical protein
MLLEVRDLKTYFFTAAGTVRAVDGVSYLVRAKHHGLRPLCVRRACAMTHGCAVP